MFCVTYTFEMVYSSFDRGQELHYDFLIEKSYVFL